MKVLAMLFALTIAGKIRHSDSKVPKRQLIEKLLYDHNGFNVAEEMILRFILPIVPPPFYDIEYDESKELQSCLDRIPRHEDGCEESTEVHKCLMPLVEMIRKRFPENVEWIPEFVLKAITTMQDVVCNFEDREALVLELEEMDQCRISIAFTSDKNKNEWMNHWSSKEQSYKKSLEVFKATPTKANLCNSREAVFDMKLYEGKCNSNKPFEAVNKYLAASFKALCA